MKNSWHKMLAGYAREGYLRHTFRAPGDLEVLIEHTHDRVLVIVRGTEASGIVSKMGLIDILRDVNVMPYKLKGYGWGPRGPLRGAQRIFKELKKHIPRHASVVIVGHSLGGQIACPLAVLLARESCKIQEVVTFGAPRSIARWSQRPETPFRLTQYIYGHDPAPIWPWLRYRHLAAKCVKLQEQKPDAGFDHWIENYEAAL